MRKIIFGLIVAMFLSSCSSSLVKIKETKTSNLKDFNSAQFIQGMKGAENIYLVPKSSTVYVTDLSGTIYLLDENDDGRMKTKSNYSAILYLYYYWHQKIGQLAIKQQIQCMA